MSVDWPLKVYTQLAQERVVVAQNSSNTENSFIYYRAVELTRPKPRVTPGGSHLIPTSHFTLSESLSSMWNSSIYDGSYALCYWAQPTSPLLIIHDHNNFPPALCMTATRRVDTSQIIMNSYQTRKLKLKSATRNSHEKSNQKLKSQQHLFYCEHIIKLSNSSAR